MFRTALEPEQIQTAAAGKDNVLLTRNLLRELLQSTTKSHRVLLISIATIFYKAHFSEAESDVKYFLAPRKAAKVA